MKRAALATPLLGPLLAVALAATACGGHEADPGPAPTTASPQPSPSSGTTGAGPADQPGRPRVTGTVAQDLRVPWGIAFLPGEQDTALVTERDSGRVLRVRPGTKPVEVARIDEASPQGEAGLLGIAIGPGRPTAVVDVFLYATTATDNRILRASYDGKRLAHVRPILTGIPNGFIHDGGRLAFGPDGYLYVSTGETGQGDLAQDKDSLAGKVLRITGDGRPAPGNPFVGEDGRDEIWSWGHRNVQGLAFDDGGRLWASEFGSSIWDELNLIRKGRNYGWPLVEGKGRRGDFQDPQIVWRTDDASPSGLAFHDGHLWMAGLRGERLWRVTVTDGRAGDPTDFFVGRYGRLRGVAVAPGGDLWVTTSNHDGRGEPAGEDDRILQVATG